VAEGGGLGAEAASDVTEEQAIESMETVLLLGRSGTAKTTCIANEMQADHLVDPDTSQLLSPAHLASVFW
jgi:ABC-type taurine transport system ATPase subunit